MARYSQDVIQSVADANDIVDIISEYVPLKRKGRSYSACCPFHNEKTPSFHVDREKQLYHCFGCGAGGNLFSFVMEKENFNFIEALQYLANKAGIALPKLNHSKNDKENWKRKRLLTINRLAGNYFYKNLKRNPIPLKYLKDREVDESLIREFALGFAPNDWQSIISYLNKSDFKIYEIVDSGLAIKNDKGHAYSRFRDRIIFPIQDPLDNVIGFGARKINEKDLGPKYLNSPDTIVFNKGTQLYNLNRARKELKKEKPLILVEGYMDVIALTKYGFKNVAAALGTAFTQDHVKLISRYTNEVILCFDGDQAGENATIKALNILNDSDLNIKIVRLPVEHDPDTFIRDKGIEAFNEELQNSLTEIEFRLNLLEKKYDLKSTEGIIKYIEDCCKLLSSLDSIQQEIYAKKISEKTNFNYVRILEKINELKVNKNTKPATKVKKVKRMPKDLEEAQFRYLAYAYRDPKLLRDPEINSEMFTHGFFRWFYVKLKDLNKVRPTINDFLMVDEDQRFENKTSRYLFEQEEIPFSQNQLEESKNILQKYFRQRMTKKLTKQSSTSDLSNNQDIFDQVKKLKKADWKK